MAGEKVADVSAEDRTRIAILHQLIKGLEGQIALTVGPYVGIKEPRVYATPEDAEKHSDKNVYLRIVDSSEAERTPIALIYVDPPGICKPVY